MTPQEKLAIKGVDINADRIFDYDHQSLTFIYDPKKDKLYADWYDKTHPEVAEEQMWLKFPDGERHALIKKGYILGRMGHLLWSKNKINIHDENAEVIPVISFWNERAPADHIKATLAKLAQEYPTFFTSDSNEVIVNITDKVGHKIGHTTLLSNWGVQFSGEQIEKKAESPECKQFNKIDMQGQPYDLSSLLGVLHAGTQNQKEKLKLTFCDIYPSYKKAIQSTQCQDQSKMLDSLATKLKCGENEGWNKVIQGGKFLRNQELRQMLHPSNINRLTQKEIDAAWDELYGKKENFSFKSWLELKGW